MKLVIDFSDKLYNFVKSKTSAGNSRDFDNYDLYDVSRCIEHGKPLDDVLDEIRTDIEEMKIEDNPHNLFFKVHNDTIESVLRIIDTYKAESEESE